MDEELVRLFLPLGERCLERRRLVRFGEIETYDPYGDDTVLKLGTPNKDAQQCSAMQPTSTTS